MAQRYATRDDVAGEAGTPGGVARELNGLPDEVFTLWLDTTAELVGLSRFGRRASHYHALLTAHAISIVVGEDGYGGDEAGPLSGEANGPASRSFVGTVAFTDEEFATTQYGRLAVSIRNTVRGRGSGVVARRGIRRVP